MYSLLTLAQGKAWAIFGIFMRIEIYKKHLNEIKKKNNKSDKWKHVFPVIGKAVFSEKIPEILKYKIMIWLASFEYLIEDNGTHVFEIKTWPEDYQKFVDYYNNQVAGLKYAKIKFLINC